MDQHIMFDCPDILREFLFYLETIQGRSPKTVNGYYIELDNQPEPLTFVSPPALRATYALPSAFRAFLNVIEEEL